MGWVYFTVDVVTLQQRNIGMFHLGYAYCRVTMRTGLEFRTVKVIIPKETKFKPSVDMTMAAGAQR